MNFFLHCILFTIFREINSVTIRAWNSESCCYRDESTDNLMQIDSATGIASIVSEPLVPNCEEYMNTTFSCNYYMICSFSYMEAPRMDISEGDYGCKYVDNSEASCEGNAGTGLTTIFPNGCFAKFGMQTNFRISRSASSCVFGTCRSSVRMKTMTHSRMSSCRLELTR